MSGHRFEAFLDDLGDPILVDLQERVEVPFVDAPDDLQEWGRDVATSIVDGTFFATDPLGTHTRAVEAVPVATSFRLSEELGFWGRLRELTRDLFVVQKKAPLEGLVFAKVEKLGEYTQEDTRHVGVPLEEANVLTSATSADVTMGTLHKVVIDLDVPAKLVASSTEGHTHLLVDVELPWDRYHTLLCALADAGLIEPGYLGASSARGYTAVRLPWVQKEVSE